jgi:hypothetical protein
MELFCRPWDPSNLVLLRLDIRCLLALRACRHIKADFLTFLQTLKAVALDRGKVREQIFAATVRSNKAKTFGVVKPLHSTCCHYKTFEKLKKTENTISTSRR